MWNSCPVYRVFARMDLVLQTNRLLVRHFEPTDADQLQRVTGDADVMRFVGDLKPLSPEKTGQMIAEAIDHYRQRGFGEYAIVSRQTGAFIGYGGFAVLPERTCVEIDYILGREFWGDGLATELAKALVAQGFDHLGFQVLGASFDPQNHASMRVAAKVGFNYERSGVDEHGLPTIYYLMKRT